MVVVSWDWVTARLLSHKKADKLPFRLDLNGTLTGQMQRWMDCNGDVDAKGCWQFVEKKC